MTTDPPEPVALLPRPRHLVESGTRLELPPIVPVSGSADQRETLRVLLGEGPGLTIEAAAEGEAVIDLTHGEHPPGGYTVRIDEHRVQISSGDPFGLIHAVQTLRQLMPTWASGLAALPGATITLPGVEITDAPALRWRGVHLDVARHFMPMPWLLQFVDLLALHKINILHLHLTDDQGWRFEVRTHPRITEVGSWRRGTRNPDWAEDDQLPHGGFYTQDQLRALVGHARVRGITVVPEIDLPGHVVSLLAALPGLGEVTDPPEVARSWGIFEQVLHLDDATITVVEDVLTELLDVFDSPWIHVGGDECPPDQWRASPAARTLAARRGLASVEELQRWFTEHLRGWLADRGRELVGWDEIVDDAEVPGAVVMSWRGIEPGLRALANGHQVVMAPQDPFYLDQYQSRDDTEPRAIGGLSTWQQVIAVDPYAQIPPDRREALLGVQAQLWSEYLPTPVAVEYAAFPRVCALAEVAWRGAAATPTEAESAMRAQVARLAARGVNVRPLDGAHPWQHGGGRRARHTPQGTR